MQATYWLAPTDFSTPLMTLISETMAIEILAAPNLRTSYMKTVGYLKEMDHDSLFLNFPENLEPLVRDLGENRLSYRVFIEEVRERKLLPEPINGWRYTAEPILKSLRVVKLYRRELEIHCYKDVNYNLLSADIATKIARLTLRATMTSRINVEDWKDILRKGMSYRREALEIEADSIHEKAGHRSVCVSGLNGRNLEQRLIGKGLRVSLIEIEEFYHPTPLEILEERLSKGDMPNEEAEALVKEHLKYVRDYILTSRNRDQAYYQWVYDKVRSLRRRIDSEEIRHLDVLLCPDDV